MDLFPGRSWLLWLVSLYCILQVSSARFGVYIPEHRQYHISIECENVELRDNNTNAFFSYYYIAGDENPTATTYFNAKDSECALGSLGETESLSELFSQLDVDSFETFIYIPPEKRHELTGAFNCNKSSVVNSIVSRDTNYQDFQLKINDSGLYCTATRPLTSLGSAAGSNVYFSDHNYDIDEYESFSNNFDFTSLIVTPFLLLPACIWIYALLSQPAKVLPIQYGLLIHIVAIAIGITLDISIPYIYNNFDYPIEVFIRRLLLLLASFGIGVWRPVQFKLFFMIAGVFSFLLSFSILIAVSDTFGILSAAIGIEPVVFLNEWLNRSVSNIVWLSSIFALYKEQDQLNTKSSCFAKVCKRSLIYCIAVFIFCSLSSPVDCFGDSIFRDYGFVYWPLRYIIEIIIPCYIWYPSQNEQLAYTASVEI
ncbi:hypothetical protein SOMG_02535 [Schizosaccharomyces osmophilus]|uniref:Intimal thickness related receptor IRP domain-containing protein n=1 Tax=Schizosaccharomyces osmophilus TaxID=2545709 RepID=A0AAE9WCA4_9SCHI|nr:uncharacterized protein SOMG_02535 [Schizosaccharomyces osmophilus]WBW73604.1 hypothetical protein SOMG_02535 [Schizosaccharomyces osmophilus]